MLLDMLRGAVLVVVGVLGLGLVPASAGSVDERRGGNHDCDVMQGTFFSSHLFEPGDRISFGYQFQPSGGQ